MKTVRTMIAICLLFATATLFAQTESKWLMKVHIPFNFTTVDQPMPAGIYKIYTVGSQRIVRITNVDGKHSAVVNTKLNYSKSAARSAHLMFSQYGSEYFLGQVWVGGEDLSRDLSPGKRASELADSGAVPRTTTVIALGNSQ